MVYYGFKGMHNIVAILPKHNRNSSCYWMIETVIHVYPVVQIFTSLTPVWIMSFKLAKWTKYHLTNVTEKPKIGVTSLSQEKFLIICIIAFCVKLIFLEKCGSKWLIEIIIIRVFVVKYISIRRQWMNEWISCIVHPYTKW